MLITGAANIQMACKLARLCALSLELKGLKRRGRSAQSIIKAEIGARARGEKLKRMYEAHIVSFALQNGLPLPLFAERLTATELQELLETKW